MITIIRELNRLKHGTVITDTFEEQAFVLNALGNFKAYIKNLYPMSISDYEHRIDIELISKHYTYWLYVVNALMSNLFLMSQSISYDVPTLRREEE